MEEDTQQQEEANMSQDNVGRKPLTPKQVEVLLQTPFDSIVETFPRAKYGYTRRELWAMRKVILETMPKAQVVQATVQDQVETDRRLMRSRSTESVTKKKYGTLLKDYEELQALHEASLSLGSQRNEFNISQVPSDGSSQAVAVIAWSDWHLEEYVDPRTVNDLNEHNLQIAEARIRAVFDNTLKLLEKNNGRTQITRVVLALLGDFINGSIHEELAESNLLMPVDAVLLAESYLISGIQFLLDNTTHSFVIHCHSGNHARTTIKNRNATEHGNSLESLLYHYLARHFEDEERVEFVIPRGYHSYVTLFDQYVIRFHHGHDLRYYGGVGGIYIPVNKAIARWNNGRRADLDVFGHFHQLKDGGLFICNGATVGYNAYALAIKADFETPKQVFFIVKQWADGRIERCGHSPIFTE